MRRFFFDAAQVTAGKVMVSGPEANHIRNVLRLRPGDEIEGIDGRGAIHICRIERLDGGGVELSLRERIAASAESPLELWIGQAFLKDKKMDTLIRQLTELGITRWMPFMATRSVPQPDPRRLASRLERWRKIAREALKQCHRNREPQIDPVVPFDGLLAAGQTCDLKILCWESAADAAPFPAPDAMPPVRSLLLVLGPEGGFTGEEVRRARAAGFLTAGLGPRILRAETAALAACALAQFLFGDMAGRAEESP